MDSTLPKISFQSGLVAPEQRFLTVPEAAAYIGRTKGWLDKARCYGNGPPFYRVGRRILYGRDELSDWLLQRRHDSTSEYPR